MSYVENYAGAAIKEIFDENRKYKLWRKLWLALAEESAHYGAPITTAQIAQLKETIDVFDYEFIESVKRATTHEIHAHIKGWAHVAPDAGKIIHLGATSCYVTDNSELVIIKDGLRLLNSKLYNLLEHMHNFIWAHKDLVCIGYTHMQAAQPTTLGKRACCWAQDFVYALNDLVGLYNELPFRGIRGATGTQASFKTLFDCFETVKAINYQLARRFGFERISSVTGQTYSRYFDSKLIKTLSLLAEAASKFAHDIRLLSATGEVAEGGPQVGSSAMPYKRNPIKSERVCSLARIVIAHASSVGTTYASQWLERSLDDSLIRKVAIQESFYATDAIIAIVTDIVKTLFIDKHNITEILNKNRSKIAQEDYMIDGVINGGDRQNIYDSLHSGFTDDMEYFKMKMITGTSKINSGYAEEQATEFAVCLAQLLACANSHAGLVCKTTGGISLPTK